mmetsp:Transcript_15594/g.51188  ORF Transcript_15594/g.51188 Transcript_15594/m.51188 type:complete len:231 (+) Transcript_15594:1970-2662(+)
MRPPIFRTKPYDGVSFSTLPISFPDAVKFCGVGSYPPAVSAPTAVSVEPPAVGSLVSTLRTTTGACLTKHKFANPRSCVNLCSTKSNTTASPSFKRGHESAKSFPENSKISKDAGLPAGSVFALSFLVSVEGSFSGSAISVSWLVSAAAFSVSVVTESIRTRPPYESCLVRPRNPRTIVPSTACFKTVGALSSTVRIVTCSAFALPSRSEGRDPTAASFATNLTSSPARS